MSPWDLLGLEPDADRSAIRRAYADRLRAMDPEADPQAFQRLRDARDAALAGEHRPLPEVTPSPPPNPEPATATPGPIPTPPVVAEEPVPTIEPDLTAIDRLRDLVMEPGLNPLPDEIAELADRILADPAMLNVQHAMAVESYFADLIVHGTPRSDPLIDPAIRHFRWDRTEDDLRGAPVIDWILRRETDRYFDVELATHHPGWKKLLDDLRTGPPERWQRLRSWYQGHRVEYLLAYIQERHPTATAALNREAVEWWTARIGERSNYPAIVRPLDGRWRTAVFARGFGQGQGAPALTATKIGVAIGIVLVPYVFVWFLLRRGYGWKARTAGFGWLLLTIGLPLQIGGSDRRKEVDRDGTMARPAPSGSSSADPAMDMALPAITPLRPFDDFEADLKIVLADLSGGTVTNPADLQRDNRVFYNESRRRWEAAKAAGRSIETWRTQTRERAVRIFYRALRGSDERLILDHAGFYASRLRWALHADERECAAILDSRQVPERLEFSDARDRLIGRALLAPASATPAAGGSGSSRIPETILQDARTAARMTKRDFSRSLDGRQGDRARCNAHIALTEALVRAGPAGIPALRKQLGGG